MRIPNGRALQDKLLFVLVLCCFSGPAFGSAKGSGAGDSKVGRNSSVRSAQESLTVETDSNSEYSRILGQLEQMDTTGQRATLLSQSFFQSLSWIGRTACINYACGILAVDQCRQVLEHALSDEALVVRDHGLRIMISTKKISDEEKRLAAERTVGDARNYRKGRPFWIVDRARGFLLAEAKNSSTR